VLGSLGFPTRGMCAELAAYRTLLRLCRQADRHPHQLPLLLGRPPRWFIPEVGKVVSAPPSQWPFVNQAICEAAGGCTEFAHPTASAARAARRHMQFVRAMGLNYIAQAKELQRRFRVVRDIADEVNECLRASGTAQDERRTDSDSAMLESPKSLALQRLVAIGGKPATVGDVLLAHAVSFLFQDVFDQAVILIDSVDMHGLMVRGYVLNKPSGSTLRELLTSWPCAEDRLWAEHLGPLLDLPIHEGGPVMDESLRESLTWLHTRGDSIVGSRQVAPGIWVGGDAEAVSILAVEDPSQVRVILGYSGWAGSQLANELERGVWVRVRTNEPGLSRLCFSKAEPISVWQNLMRGANMPLLADFPRSEAIDERIHKIVMEHYKASMEEFQETFEVDDAANNDDPIQQVVQRRRRRSRK